MNHRMCRPLLALVVWAMASFGAATAASAADGATIDATLAASMEEGSGALGALKKAGAKYRHVLIAERLPSGGAAAERVLVEFEVSVDGAALRFPARLRREEDGLWAIDWLPERDYAEALLNVVRSGQLPRSTSSPAWSATTRLPAFGVVATRKRIVTPLGTIDPAANPDDAPRQGDLRVLVELSRHAKQWVAQVLANDPAPAAFDLVLDRRLDWRTLNEIVFSIAGAGLYQAHLIAATDDGKIAAVPVSAPVAMATTSGPPPLAIGFYQRRDGFGFRVNLAGEMLRDDATCDEQMSLCATQPQPYGQRLRRLMGPEDPPGRAMFAAPADVAVADAIAFVEATADTLALSPHRIMIGYIQK